MEFNFKEAFGRIGMSIVTETNHRIEEILRNESEMDEPRKTNLLILNEMINDNIRITLGVLEEYHQAIMKYLSEKGL